MLDERPYIRLHDGMPDHPKVEGLSDKAFRLLIETWCWSSRHLADGRMPAAMWKRRGTPKTRRELEDAGLVVCQGDEIEMHDYVKHQRSAAGVEEARGAMGDGGRLGNHKRWHVAKGVVKQGCEFCEQQPPPPGERRVPDTKPDSGSDRVPDQVPDRVSIGSASQEQEEEKEITTHPANAAAVTNAQARELIATWHQNSGTTLTRSRRSELAAVATAILDDGGDPNVLSAALDDWARRGRTPGFLRHSYDDAAQARAAHHAPLSIRPSTTDSRVAAVLALRTPDRPQLPGAAS